ncbi:MAG: type I glyceraldehyde-3-phosphate dehydrogenase, partial [Myxococcota bacterium]
MSAKIAINGFGRIGRCVARILKETGGEQLELVAINDLTPAHTLAHLLQFDSVHGEWTREVFAEGSAITIGSQTIPVYSEADPSKLPWAELSVDLVLECTGRFRSREGAGKHLNAGAKRVVISAPGEIGIDHTLCMGINSDSFDPMSHQIISNASCTTNCLAPLAKVLHERFGLLKGHMVTVHSYTNDQRILDSPHQDLRRARAAALSMIPTTTGAAKAIELVMPELKGTLDGVAIRVPTPNVSIVCLTAQVARPTTR